MIKELKTEVEIEAIENKKIGMGATIEIETKIEKKKSMMVKGLREIIREEIMKMTSGPININKRIEKKIKEEANIGMIIKETLKKIEKRIATTPHKHLILKLMLKIILKNHKMKKMAKIEEEDLEEDAVDIATEVAKEDEEAAVGVVVEEVVEEEVNPQQTLIIKKTLLLKSMLKECDLLII